MARYSFARHPESHDKQESGEAIQFTARVRIDTPKERDYFRNGGILHFVLRQLAGAAA